MDEIKNQQCPICKKNTLTLREELKEVSYFGKLYLFSMECSDCNYKKSDVESETKKKPVKITFTIESEKDLSVRVIKSSTASIRIPQLRISVTAGSESDGYVSNIEGVLGRFYKITEGERDIAEDEKTRKKAKKLLKKLWKAKSGDLKLKVILEDPEGNSGILSEKAEIKNLK